MAAQCTANEKKHNHYQHKWRHIPKKCLNFFLFPLVLIPERSRCRCEQLRLDWRLGNFQYEKRNGTPYLQFTWNIPFTFVCFSYNFFLFFVPCCNIMLIRQFLCAHHFNTFSPSKSLKFRLVCTQLQKSKCKLYAGVLFSWVYFFFFEIGMIKTLWQLKT